MLMMSRRCFHLPISSFNNTQPPFFTHCSHAAWLKVLDQVCQSRESEWLRIETEVRSQYVPATCLVNNCATRGDVRGSRAAHFLSAVRFLPSLLFFFSCAANDGGCARTLAMTPIQPVVALLHGHMPYLLISQCA